MIFKVGDIVQLKALGTRIKWRIISTSSTTDIDGNWTYILDNGRICYQDELVLVRRPVNALVKAGDTVRIVLESVVDTVFESKLFTLASDPPIHNSCIDVNAEYVKSVEIIKKASPIFKQGDVIKGSKDHPDAFLFDPEGDKTNPFVFMSKAGLRVSTCRLTSFDEEFYGTPRVVGNLSELTGR